MREITGKMPGIMAIGMALGGLPLLASMVVFLQLMTARNAGHPISADGLGLAVLSALAYGLALLSFVIGAGYFAYKRLRHALYPRTWHAVILVCSSIELLAPVLFFLIT